MKLVVIFREAVVLGEKLMKNQKIAFKKDKFKSARGGHSRLLNINCRKCNHLILTYQKDGPGNLRRLYMDRISSPEELVDLQYQDLHMIKALMCPNCAEVVGTPYIYAKEKRKAFRLDQDAVVKKLQRLL